MLSYFGGTVELLLLVIGLISGVLSILRDLQMMYNPAQADPKRVYWGWVRIAFIISAGLVWYNAFSSMKGREADLHNAELALKVEKGKPPLIIQTTINPTEIIKALSLVTKQQEEHTIRTPPLKAKLLDLSKRILTFALGKSQDQPISTINSFGTSSIEDQAERQRVAFIRFSNQMQSEYATAFDAEIVSALNELRTQGIPVSNNWFTACNSQFAGVLVSTVQRCGTQLRVFADQIN